MNSEQKSGSGFLAAGGIAAILASTCCLGPLILVVLGFSGSWIGNLTALEPYRPLFLGFTLIVLVLAALRIFRTEQACDSGGSCSASATGSRRTQKIFFSTVALLAIVAFVFPYLARYFY
jgi:mercuric ion transport protein